MVEQQHGGDWPRLRLRSNRDGDGAVVVGRRADGRVLFCEVERPIVGLTLLELPRGQAEPEDADAVATASRELLEETGHRLVRGRLLGRIYPDTGLLGDGVHVVVADEIELGDATAAEFPVQSWLDAAQVASAMRDGRIRDGISIAALALVDAERS